MKTDKKINKLKGTKYYLCFNGKMQDALNEYIIF